MLLHKVRWPQLSSGGGGSSGWAGRGYTATVAVGGCASKVKAVGASGACHCTTTITYAVLRASLCSLTRPHTRPHTHTRTYTQGFRVKHFFNFWVFFTRRNKKMRQAWITTAAQHIEAILRNAINAFKANAAEARRQRRIKRAVFEAVQHITRRNIAVRRIAREVRSCRGVQA